MPSIVISSRAQVELDRLEVGILGQQLHGVAAAAEALDGHLVDRCARLTTWPVAPPGAMHREQVAVEYAGRRASTRPRTSSEVIRARREQVGIDLVAARTCSRRGSGCRRPRGR
jgi:hypothetical protein